MVAAVGVSSTGRQRREWHRRAGCGGAAAVWQQQCGRGGSVAAAAVWRRRPGGIGVTVSAWRCGSSGRAAVVWHHQRTSSRGGPMWRERCGSSGVAAAADGSSWAEPAGDDQSGGRACVRAGAQTWLAHLRGRQRGRGERASGRWRAFFEFTHKKHLETYFNSIFEAAPRIAAWWRLPLVLRRSAHSARLGEGTRPCGAADKSLHFQDAHTRSVARTSDICVSKKLANNSKVCRPLPLIVRLRPSRPAAVS